MEPRPPSPPDVRAMTAELLALDRTLGARHAAPLALRSVRAVEAAEAAYGADTAISGLADPADLAEFFEVAAWILFDAERHGPSYRLNRRALALTRRLPEEERSIELLVLSVLSMQQAHLMRPRASLRTSSAVLAGRDLPPRVAALFHVRQARAYAQLGARARAMRSLDAAREMSADGPSERDPAWSWWFDRAELDGHHGLVLADLGDAEGAAALLHAAVASDGGPAYRALFAADLARVLARAGAWRETDALLSALAESAPRMGSVRALNSLRQAVAAVGEGRRVPRALRGTTEDLAVLLTRELPRERTGEGEAHPPPTEPTESR
ncbi:DNA-binding protein [Streptomyces barkulensis]|uniref:DNA-binding protein n=1 Tax=Streptomyces barkulensis TaxID=1257026 RepID=UPI000C6D0AD1|nr:DNA-binding protein [Streptomyces barkulensis]